MGREYERACRVALEEWRHRSRGGTRDWWHHPLVEAVLAEIGRRYWQEQDELDARYRMYGI